MSVRDATQAVAEALGELFLGAERERRLIVRAGPHWQVLSVADGRRSLLHRSAKSGRMPAEHKLGGDQANQLRALGFAKPPGVGDWERRLDRPSADAVQSLAEEVVYIARRLYQADAQMELDLEIDDRTHPENPDLIAAMRKVATPQRQEADRHAMYNAMVNATFLVLLDAGVDAATDPEDALRAIGQLSGRPVFAVFTDFASLRLFDPLEREYLPLHGSELFELLMEIKAASVQVNPQGNVGGELYAHEIEALAEGVRRFRRRRVH